MAHPARPARPAPPSPGPRAQRRVLLPSGPALVGGVYAICVLGLVAFFTATLLLGDEEPYRDQGPVDSLVTVAAFGTAALVVGVALVLLLVRTPERARVGSLVLMALAVASLPFFWSGAPGVLGASAAWCAGLTRGGRPLGGAARAAGVVGACIALLDVVLVLGGVVVGGR